MYHTLPARGVAVHQYDSRHGAKWLWYSRRENSWAVHMGRMLKLLPPQNNALAAPEKQYENYRLNWIFGFFLVSTCRLNAIFGFVFLAVEPTLNLCSMNTKNKTGFVCFFLLDNMNPTLKITRPHGFHSQSCFLVFSIFFSYTCIIFSLTSFR